MVEEDLPTFAASVEGSGLPPGYDDPTTSRRRTTRRPLNTEHVYTIGAEKKAPWVFLRVYSRTKKTKRLPLFVEGDTVSGMVELDLEKAENIRAVTIKLRGETRSGQSWAPEIEATVPFWTHVTTLWSMSMGEPGTMNTTTQDAKLSKGKYVWPFSIKLPQQPMRSNIPEGSAVDMVLPPSFTERDAPLCVDYKLGVTLSRGRLRLDNNLFTSFSYLPLSSPRAPSLLRQLAYRERWSPPGPQSDPEGWEVLGPSSVMGTLFDSREVEAACLFALAKPLCYTRGTFIPFAVTISCSDSLALDLFAARGSLVIELIRTLHVKSDGGSRPKRTESKIPTCVGTGVYWLSNENCSTSETRKLEGEISIKSDLKPSFEFTQLDIKYHVSLVLAVPGFNGPGGDAALTFSQDVKIASDPAPGPTPRSRARRESIT